MSTIRRKASTGRAVADDGGFEMGVGMPRNNPLRVRELTDFTGTPDLEESRESQSDAVDFSGPERTSRFSAENVLARREATRGSGPKTNNAVRRLFSF